MTAIKTGRNDPCHCGSGKKYKQCCLERDQVATASLQSDMAALPTLLNSAMEHFHANRFQEAEASCQKILQIQPDHPDALHMLGVIAYQIGMFDVAAELLTGVIAIAPGFAQAYFNLGNALKQLGRLDDAIVCYQQAVELKPDYAKAHNNLADLLQHQGRLREATESYLQALKIEPDLPEVHYNLGDVFKEQGKLEDALRHLQRAVALKPDYPAAHWNMALLELLMGNFAEGWPLYEWRWKESLQSPPRNFSQPLWLGDQPIAGQTLLIHAEQGLGDAIQFCRYVPMLVVMGAKVVLEVKPPLAKLMSTLAVPCQIVQRGEQLPAFDMHCPIMSLPLAFKTQLSNIPAPVPYLFADAEKQAAWRNKLGNKSGLRVGIAWAGNAAHKHDRDRSIAPDLLRPLLQLPIEFHSLQKERRPEDSKVLDEIKQIHSHEADLHDFSDTAALMQEMDLIISVDTSVAHLAGAMGKPVWILLPFVPDFRWLMKRPDSPWYPSATLFRQAEPAAGWVTVIEEVGRKLQSMASA